MRAAPGQEAPPGAAAFPWDEAMTAGFTVLGLSSADFWAMTPREFARAVAPLAARTLEPMRRADLRALMSRFPDQEAT